MSEQTDVEALIEARVEWFPAESKASTATVWAEPRVSPLTL